MKPAAVAILAAFLLAIVVGTVALAFGSPIVFGTSCTMAMVLLIVGLILVSQMSRTYHGRLPLPPPVQHSQTPQGTIQISCPNCGGTTREVDRFGVATCAYCSNRFLVH